MKKTLLLLITATLFALTTNAQTNLYNKYMQQGKTYYNKSEFLTALERFDLAYEFAKTETQKTDTKNWKNKSRKKIREQQADLQEAIKKSNRILKALLPEGVKNIYRHFKTLADKQFALGENAEALQNYNLAKNAPDIPTKNTAANDVENVKNCLTWQKNALQLLKNEKYEQAEQEILKVLKINPNSRNDIIIASAINPLYGLALVQGGEFMRK